MTCALCYTFTPLDFIRVSLKEALRCFFQTRIVVQLAADANNETSRFRVIVPTRSSGGKTRCKLGCVERMAESFLKCFHRTQFQAEKETKSKVILLRALFQLFAAPVKTKMKLDIILSIVVCICGGWIIVCGKQQFRNQVNIADAFISIKITRTLQQHQRYIFSFPHLSIDMNTAAVYIINIYAGNIYSTCNKSGLIFDDAPKHSQPFLI